MFDFVTLVFFFREVHTIQGTVDMQNSTTMPCKSVPNHGTKEPNHTGMAFLLRLAGWIWSEGYHVAGPNVLVKTVQNRDGTNATKVT